MVMSSGVGLRGEVPVGGWAGDKVHRGLVKLSLLSSILVLEASDLSGDTGGVVLMLSGCKAVLEMFESMAVVD